MPGHTFAAEERLDADRSAWAGLAPGFSCLLRRCGTGSTRRALVALLLWQSPATAQQPTGADLEEDRPSATLSAALSLASTYDNNLDYVQSSLPSYGALAGVEGRFQSRPDRPALLVEYMANIQSYSRTDKWDRVSQRGRVVLAARPGPAWTLDLASTFSLLGATEDRELVDELVVGPRIEYAVAGNSVQLSGGQQFRRNRDDGPDATSRFAAAELRGRIGRRHRWGTSYRYESVDSEDPRRRNVRSTYGAQYSRRMFTRSRVGIGLRYRARRYPERMVQVNEEDVPRQDRGWQVQSSWVTNLRPGPELRLQHRYELRHSNVSGDGFDAHRLTLTLRQPISFTGQSRPPGARPGATPPAPSPMRPPAPRFTRSALGEHQVCALTGDGIAHCWPADAQANEITTSSVVSSTLRFSAIAVGHGYACALSSDGRPYCWGGPYPAVPTALHTRIRFTSLAAGGGHVCGLAVDGAAFCWGDNSSGALGSHSPHSNVPVAVAGGHRFHVLAAGWQHTCGLTGDGTAYCWGANQQGELGALFTSARSTPTPALVTGGHRFSGLSAGSTHTCGATPGGQVYCWGANSWGQLGNGSAAPSRVPAGVSGELAFVEIAAGAEHTCALTRHGELYCWGRNERGQLGSDSNAAVQVTPVRAAGGARYKAVVAFRTTCGITVDDELRCWGTN